MNQLWPLAITIVSVLPLIAMGRGRMVAGAYLGLAAQAVWVCWALVTEQWAFLGNAAIFTAVYWRNLRLARQEPA